MYIGRYIRKRSPPLIYEVVDNSIDEAMAGYCDTIKVTLTNRGSAIIEDNGRGIPVAEHPSVMKISDSVSRFGLVSVCIHNMCEQKFNYGEYFVSIRPE